MRRGRAAPPPAPAERAAAGPHGPGRRRPAAGGAGAARRAGDELAASPAAGGRGPRAPAAPAGRERRSLQRRHGRRADPRPRAAARRRRARSWAAPTRSGCSAPGGATGCCGWRARSPTWPAVTVVAGEDVLTALSLRQRRRAPRRRSASGMSELGAVRVRLPVWPGPGCWPGWPATSTSSAIGSLALLELGDAGADRRGGRHRARRDRARAARTSIRTRPARRRPPPAWSSSAAAQPAYPRRLAALAAPPAVLHVAGGLRAPAGRCSASDPVAIVGARRASPYGLEVAAVARPRAGRGGGDGGQRDGPRDRRRRPPGRARRRGGTRSPSCPAPPRRRIRPRRGRCTAGSASRRRGRLRAPARHAGRGAGCSRPATGSSPP